MSDPLDALPPHLRASVAELLTRLPADWTVHAVRNGPHGWWIILHDEAGHVAAEAGFFDKPEPRESKYNAR